MNNVEQSRATLLTLAVEWALELEKRIKESGTIFMGEVGRGGPWGLLGGWWRCSWGDLGGTFRGLGWVRRGKQVGSIQSTGSACSDTQPGCQQQRQIKFQPILDY